MKATSVYRIYNDKYGSYFKSGTGRTIWMVKGHVLRSFKKRFGVSLDDHPDYRFIEYELVEKETKNSDFISRFRSENIAVTFKTLKECEEFYAILTSFDIHFLYAEIAVKWARYKEQLSFALGCRGLEFSPLSFYKRDGWKEVKYKDIC